MNRPVEFSDKSAFSIFGHAGLSEAEPFSLVGGALRETQARLYLVQAHLLERAVHEDLVHEVARLDVVELREVVRRVNVLPLKEVVNSIHICRLERVDKVAERDRALHYLAQHLLD